MSIIFPNKNVFSEDSKKVHLLADSSELRLFNIYCAFYKKATQHAA